MPFEIDNMGMILIQETLCISMHGKLERFGFGLEYAIQSLYKYDSRLNRVCIATCLITKYDTFKRRRYFLSFVNNKAFLKVSFLTLRHGRLCPRCALGCLPLGTSKILATSGWKC